MRDISKHGTRSWATCVVLTSLVVCGPISSIEAQEAVDARIQALERQMEEMRRTMESMAAELESLRTAQPPQVVEAPAPAPIRGLPPEEQPSAVRDQSPQETITTTEQATEPVVSSSPGESQGLDLRSGQPGDQRRQRRRQDQSLFRR